MGMSSLWPIIQPRVPMVFEIPIGQSGRSYPLLSYLEKKTSYPPTTDELALELLQFCRDKRDKLLCGDLANVADGKQQIATRGHVAWKCGLC